jgi:hypothetical protein
MRHRGATVEHPFGTLKCRAGWNHFLVRGEWSLMALAYNFTKVMNELGQAAFGSFCSGQATAAPA